MVNCPRCGSTVDQLHPLPPETFTRDLINEIGGTDIGTDPELCGDCVNKLMSGEVPS